MVKRILVLVRKENRANEAKEPNRVDVGGHQKQDNCFGNRANAQAVFSHSKSRNFRTTEGDKEVESCQQQQNTSKASKKRPPLIIYTARKKASKKRPPLTTDADDTSDEKKLLKRTLTCIDLSDVPPQAPIVSTRSKGKPGASKYQGVKLLQNTGKYKIWSATIDVDGKQLHIGCYGTEKEAAVDYARAFFKYRAPKSIIDLSDVPPQTPILRRNYKAGTSKYKGVNCHDHDYKHRNKNYHARITIDGKNHSLGWYEDEEEAAVDYARAFFKYRSKDVIDLSDVPPQEPILRSNGKSLGNSKYQGIYFMKARNKWQARIKVNEKSLSLGYYDEEEEAASEYARALFKYRPDAFRSKTSACTKLD